MSADGRLYGAPGAEGTYSIELTATDSDAADPETAARRFQLVVKPPAADVLIVRELAGSEAIKVDGVLNESFWNPTHPIDKLVVGSKRTIKAAFDAVWKNGTLYVGVKVTDRALHTNNKELAGGDSVELFIDGRNNREDTFNIDDLRVVVAPIKGWYAKLFSAPPTWGMSYECRPTDNGFAAEFGIRIGGCGCAARHAVSRRHRPGSCRQ